MRLTIAVVLSLLLTSCVTPATSFESSDANQLVGTWKVDLRPTPGAEAYFQEFVVAKVNGKTFSGTFYGSTITQARINTDWNTVRIAFVTEDQSGPYNHSAVLTNGVLEGLSNSTGRDFLSYWSARKN